MLKKITFINLLIIVLGNCLLLRGQSQNTIIGNLGVIKDPKAAIFDLSDPKAVNIKVSVWGAVRNPGYYIVPDYTDVNALLSFAGGPLENSNLENLRVFRVEKETGKNKIINFNYNDLLWGDSLKNFVSAPTLLPGDIVLIPIEPKFFLKDYIQVALSSTAAIFSVLSLIVQLNR